MVYQGSSFSEVIIVHTFDNPKERYFIELTRIDDEPVLNVDCVVGEQSYFWEFDISRISDYERIKFNILNTVFECDTIYDLMETLEEIFTDGFADIMIGNVHDECDVECCGDCASCVCEIEKEYNKNLN